jgi:hypothetical protein
MRLRALAVLLLASLPIQGCVLGTVTISIPDFATKSVQGVWLWRSTSFNGVYEREVQFSFEELRPGAAGEALDYTAAPADGSPPVPITTYVVRDAANPDRVIVHLVFSRDEAVAFYRASTYNQSGDSPLSSEILPL